MVAYGSRTAHSNLYHTWASVKTTDFHSWQVSAVVRPGKMWAEGAQTPIWIWTAKVVSMPVPERCWEMLGGFKHGLIFSMRAGIKLTICWDIVAVFQINIRPNTVWFSNSTDVVIVGMGCSTSGQPVFWMASIWIEDLCQKWGNGSTDPIWPIWLWECPITVPNISEVKSA